MLCMLYLMSADMGINDDIEKKDDIGNQIRRNGLEYMNKSIEEPDVVKVMKSVDDANENIFNVEEIYRIHVGIIVSRPRRARS